VGEKKLTADGNRELKERLVAEGRAHAALVFDGELALGGASSVKPRSFRTSTTVRNTRRVWTNRRTSG
jgi:hypothetical protein